MKYRILCIGKIKDEFYRKEIVNLCNDIQKQNHQIEICEYSDLKIPDNLKEQNKEGFLEKECSKMISQISNRDFVVALCIEGKEISTSQHKQYVLKALDENYETITYVIGGSLGLPQVIKKRANLKMSFSKMTFPHQMMRMILCEEIKNLS